MSNIEMMKFIEMVANAPNPETMPGTHLSDEARAKLAFAALNNFRSKAKDLLGPQPFDIGVYIDDNS